MLAEVFSTFTMISHHVTLAQTSNPEWKDLHDKHWLRASARMPRKFFGVVWLLLHSAFCAAQDRTNGTLVVVSVQPITPRPRLLLSGNSCPREVSQRGTVFQGAAEAGHCSQTGTAEQETSRVLGENRQDVTEMVTTFCSSMSMTQPTPIEILVTWLCAMRLRGSDTANWRCSKSKVIWCLPSQTLPRTSLE